MVGRPKMPANPHARPDRRELSAAIGLTLLAASSLLSPSALTSRALAQTPERIVVVGGVITEVLYALGLQDTIAGVDSTSQFPSEALRDKANVGYVRALSAEGVLSLKPSIVIAINGAGPPGRGLASERIRRQARPHSRRHERRRRGDQDRGDRGRCRRRRPGPPPGGPDAGALR